MMGWKLYAALAVVGVAAAGGLGAKALITKYGEARYQAGVEHQSNAQAQAALALTQRLRAEKQAADKRLAAERQARKRDEAKFHAEIEQYKQRDETLKAWLAQRVHPTDVCLVERLRHTAAGGGDGWLSARSIADLRFGSPCATPDANERRPPGHVGADGARDRPR